MDRRRGQDRPEAAEGRDGEPGEAPDDGSGDDADAGYARPSRSARKRAAEALQKLGERLTELREPELAALDLPEELLAAVRDARRLGHTPAQARARQYIGRLMRQIDTTAIERALAERAGNWRPRAKLPR
jgi:ribosome-associated protein